CDYARISGGGTHSACSVVVLLGHPGIRVVQQRAREVGGVPPYAAAVEAAAVRNRWGGTSTPRVASGTLEISVPMFFVVIPWPVVAEIQSAFVGGLDPSRTGRD